MDIKKDQMVHKEVEREKTQLHYSFFKIYLIRWDLNPKPFASNLSINMKTRELDRRVKPSHTLWPISNAV